MGERRGSQMYDPARDVFTNSDEAPAAENDGQILTSSPLSAKRKRSVSPSSRSRTPLPPAPKENTRLSADRAKMPPAKKLKSSPSEASNQPSAPLPMTAANLSQLPRVKKVTGTRPKGIKPRPERSPTDRRRSRSPTRQAADTGGRRRRRTPPRQTHSPKPATRSPSPPPPSPPRQRKRPGAGARISAADQEAVKKRRLERDQAERSQAHVDAVARGVQDVVKQHYNAVPQRGREWRKTGSVIKGLRSFNNWVKSAIIQKFSPSEDFTPGARERGVDGRNGDERGLLVLDIGCGKGGDLQKWQAAPQKVDLYVGLDPADVSIEQARERYLQMNRGGHRGPRNRQQQGFHAEFVVKDCFGEWLGDVPIVHEVGIDGNVGPDGQSYGRPATGGGFDVVAMMFCMHYAFESEAKAKMMLKNVAGALKKGGRFLGVIPNSDVLTGKVEEFVARRNTAAGKATKESTHEDDDDDWDPERPSVIKSNGRSDAANDHHHDDTNAPKGEHGDDDDDDWDPEKPSAADPPTTAQPTVAVEKTGEAAAASAPQEEESLEWGNGIYRVKFPSKVPEDGIFRPAFGWKYFYFLEEAVEEVPEYVVPWEAFRAMAVDYDLELQYRKPFNELWDAEKDDAELGPLSERMGVRERDRGPLMVSDEEFEAASFYHAFCFYKA